MKNAQMTGSEILVACEKVSSEAEVTGIERSYQSLDFNPSRSLPGSGERAGWGLRMIRNRKLGVSGEWGTINQFQLVDRVIGSCRYGPEALFSFPEQGDDQDVTENTEVTPITHDDVNSYLKSIQSRVKEIHSRASLSARLTWGIDSFTIMNSRGLIVSYSKAITSAVFSITLPSESGLLQSGYSLNTVNSLPVENDVLEMLLLPLHPEDLDSLSSVGRKRVVFSPVAFSLLLQAIKSGVSGKLYAEGASPLADMDGKKVLDSRLTIRDLPRLSNGAASAPFDSEGTATRDKILFDEGVFTGFLHDLSSAAECGVVSTGSSGRNLGEHSRPVCTNLTVDPALTGSSNTLDETGSGILVTNILSAGGGNAATGSFTLDCGRVYLFRRGEIQGYYDGCVLSGNVYDALSRVIALGSRQYRCGADLLPFISLDGVSVR